MANKRELKKYIHRVCGEMAAELLSASNCIEGFDQEKVGELVCRIARLQVNALAHCTFAFDKTAGDFTTAKDYHTALAAYNRMAYNKVKADMNAEIAAILKEMNAMLPQSVRNSAKSNG